MITLHSCILRQSSEIIVPTNVAQQQEVTVTQFSLPWREYINEIHEEVAVAPRQ